MNTKVVFGVIFAFLCTLQLGYALKCYICDSEASCKSAKSYECNQVYANQTLKYLDAYYANVNTNTTSNAYVCMRQDIKFSISGTVKYKGCLYAHVNSCGYTFRPYYQQSSTKFSCNQCSDRNGCNPADRSTVSLTAMVVPLISVLIFKYFM